MVFYGSILLIIETGDCMTISRREYDDFKDTISNKDKEIEHLQELNRDLTIKVLEINQSDARVCLSFHACLGHNVC